MESQFENSISTIKLPDLSILNNINISKILKHNKKDIEISSKEYISQMYKDIIGNNYIMKSPFGYNNYLIYYRLV